MRKYFENNGQPDNRGRFVFVIDREDGTNPIRTYGTSHEEVLMKVSDTLDHAERKITRLEREPAPQRTAPAPSAPAAPARRTITASEIAQATVDVGNPAKAGKAVRTLLAAEGFDLDELREQQEVRRVAQICTDWYGLQDDPRLSDQRNQSRIVDKATLLSGGRGRITAEMLDRAYSILDRGNDLFDAHPETQPAPPEETLESRTVARPRGAPATSYDRHKLRVVSPGATRKQFYTREQIAAMNSDDFVEKVLGVPEVLDWYNREYAPRAKQA